MSGSKKPAIDGTLIILAAGDQELFNKATPCFDIMGKKSFFLGEVGAGVVLYRQTITLYTFVDMHR